MDRTLNKLLDIIVSVNIFFKEAISDLFLYMDKDISSSNILELLEIANEEQPIVLFLFTIVFFIYSIKTLSI